MEELAREKKRDPSSFPMVREARRKAGLVSIPHHLVPVWEAYFILNRARPMGFAAPQRLALSEIVACGSLLEIPFGIRFVRTIQAMDDLYLNHLAEETRRRK